MNGISVLLMLSLTSQALATHGHDTSVCTVPLNHTKGPQFSLPQKFSVRVECNIIDKNKTTDIHEWFDSSDNRGVVHQWQGGLMGVLIYDYQTNELIEVDESLDQTKDPLRCTVKDLSQSENNYLFGLNRSNGVDRIYSAAGAFRFRGKYVEDYLGVKRVRGMLVDVFRSCVYWATFDATMTVTWYFTAANVWHSATALPHMPVRCEIQGVSWAHPPQGSYHFHHIYEFSEFRKYDVPESRFEIPKGTYCPNRKNTKPLPKLTDFFTYSTEIIKPEAKTSSFIKEYYDFSAHLVRYDYFPQDGSAVILQEVHDYSTGVAYIMNPVVGNCSYHPIEKTSTDAKMLDANHVRIRTSKEFFNFANTSYHYVGERTVRGIQCDVWVARRTDWSQVTSGKTSLFEWYFAKPEVTENLGYSSSETNVPVMLEVTATMKNRTEHFIYNFYDYTEAQPMIWKFDISQCFDSSHRKNFQFALTGQQYQNVVSLDEDLFRYSVILEIQARTSLTPLRMSNMQFDYTESSILVSFTMLDVSPIPGDVNRTITQIPMDDAASFLTNYINKGTFKIQMNFVNIPNTIVLVGKPYSTNSTNTVIKRQISSPTFHNPSQGYSSGVMAAVAISVFFVTFIIGFLILFMIYKLRGGSFVVKPFDSDIQPVVTE